MVSKRVMWDLRFEFLLEPEDRLFSLHVNIQRAKHSLLLRVDVRDQLQSLHVNGDTDPVTKLDIDVLCIKLVLRVAANLLQVQIEVRLQLAHVELEVAHLRQFVHLLNKQHGVVL